MLVEYTKPNLLTVFTPVNANLKTATPTGYRIVPGVNEIRADQWKEFEKSPKIKNYLKDGTFRIVEKVEPTDEKTSLAQLEVERAQKVVELTLDKKLLEDWGSGETRPSVLSTINKKIAEIDRLTTKKSN